jgi:membrane-associated phospholipid phosphatase
MTNPLDTKSCRVRRRVCPLASVFHGAGIVILACGALHAAAAQELPAAAVVTAAGIIAAPAGEWSPAPKPETTAVQEAGGTVAPAPQAESDNRPTPDARSTTPTADASGTTATAAVAEAVGESSTATSDGNGSTRTTTGNGMTPATTGNGMTPATTGNGMTPATNGNTTATATTTDGNATATATDGSSSGAPQPGQAAGAASPPFQSRPEASESGGVSAGMPVWKLFAIDARDILTAPAHWTGHDWTVFGVGVAGAAALTLADQHLRTEALRGDSPLETRLANDFRYFGNYAAFGVLGAFYVGGRIGHDDKAQETALDGLIASILAGGVITGVIKEVVGRVRPAAHQGVYEFHPFSGNASFPSGESTEAFAAASVIATQYPHLWVEVLCYGSASLVAFARMREDGHWASDVAFGALIGTTVGRAVVHLNRRLRARVNVAPLLAPHAQGLTLQTAF